MCRQKMKKIQQTLRYLAKVLMQDFTPQSELQKRNCFIWASKCSISTLTQL